MATGQYKQWCTEDGQTLLKGWRRAGLTMAEIAGKVGVATGTLYEWKKMHPEIGDALKKGKELCDFKAEEALIGLFEKRYLTDEMTEIYEEDGVQKKHIKKTKREIDPSVSALIFYLKCRAGWDEQAAQSLQKAKLGEKVFEKAMKEIENTNEVEGGGESAND